MARGKKVSIPLPEPEILETIMTEVTETTEAPVAKKARKAATGPRTWKPIQVVVRVYDENGAPVHCKNARVEVLLATKDELTAVRKLRDAMIADDYSVQVITAQINTAE